jgi:hypothetical protein
MAADPITALVDRALAQSQRQQTAAGAVLPGGASAALQGLTFGFGDELTAFLRSRLGATPYDQALAQERANLAQYRDQNPGRALAFEVAGSLPTTAAAMALAPVTGGGSGAAAAANAARVAATTGRAVQAARSGAAAGAATGAVQGFGEGEGGAGERLSSAAGGGMLGGLAGGALGAVTPAVTQGAVNAYRAVRGGVPEAERRLAADPGLGRVAGDLAEDLQARGAGAPVQQVTMAERMGESGMATAEALANAPGQTRQLAVDLLRPRGVGANSRTDMMLSDIFGNPEDAFTRRMAIQQRMGGQTSPKYQEAFRVAEGWTPQANDLEVFTRMPGSVLNRAAARARDLATTEGRRVNFRFRMQDGELAVPDSVERGNLASIFEVMPTAQDLHYFRSALGDEIGKMLREGDRVMARRLIPLKGDLTDTLDRITSANGQSLYRQARNEWADSAATLDAQELGRGIFGNKVDVRELRLAIRDMSDGEREGFSVGVMDAIRSRLDNVADGRDGTRAILGNEKQRQLLRAALDAVYPDERDASARFNMLSRFIDRERSMKGFESQALGGSATARRIAAQTALGQAASGAGIGGAIGGLGGFYQGDLQTGAILGAAAGAGARAATRSLTNRAEGSAVDAMGQRLFATDPFEQMRMLQRLEQVRRDELLAQLRRAQTYPAGVGAFAGQQSGGAVQPQQPRGLLAQ